MKISKKLFIIIIFIAITFCVSKVYAENTIDESKKEQEKEPVVEEIIGDLNNDKRISVTDLSILKSHFVGITIITDEAVLKRADLNNDGKISMTDLALLRSKLVYSAEEFILSQNEDVIKYLEKNSQFISEFEFTNPSELKLDLGNKFMLNYIYGNSAEELNLSLSDLIKIAESVGYDVSKIKGIDNVPFVSLEYLYSNTFVDLAFSTDSVRNILTGLGYDPDEVRKYLDESTPYISTIKQIKDNYYSLFGTNIPEDVITKIKSDKYYLSEYDAILYTKPRAKLKEYTITNVIGEITGGKYDLLLNDEKVKSNVVLKKVNNNYYFVSIKK